MEQYIGIDLRKTFIQVCVVDALGSRCWETRFATTADGIAAFLAQVAPQAHVAVEASGPTWTFVDRLREQVADVQVVDAGKTRLKAGYAAKTDRLDARRLADALRRDSVATVYYPPPRIRDLRELCRYRLTLVRVRAGVKQRIHALLLRHGLMAPQDAGLWHGPGAQWLARLTLPGRAGESLVGLRRLPPPAHHARPTPDPRGAGRSARRSHCRGAADAAWNRAGVGGNHPGGGRRHQPVSGWAASGQLRGRGPARQPKR